MELSSKNKNTPQLNQLWLGCLIIKDTFILNPQKKQRTTYKKEWVKMKILVLGGTQFFGKKAVQQLINQGHQVTLATRGTKPNPFQAEAHHIVIDAKNQHHPGWQTIQDQQWDAIFDNICYTTEEAELRIDKLADRTNHYYVTSSMAVYRGDQDGYRETDFNPSTYQIDSDIPVTYGEGKRQMEHILFNQAPFNVTAFRFPIVLDDDDYTERLHFYIRQIINGQAIYFSHPNIHVNYVKGTQAANSIVWAIENKKSGIFNVSSRDSIPVSQFIDWLEAGTGCPVQVEYGAYPEQQSPFKTNHHQYLISDKIEAAGFELDRLSDWLPALISRLTQQIESE